MTRVFRAALLPILPYPRHASRLASATNSCGDSQVLGIWTHAALRRLKPYTLIDEARLVVIAVQTTAHA